MAEFTHLGKLLEYADDAFTNFYETMLKDKRLSFFFDSDEQIDMLIQKQKKLFIDTLILDKERLKEVYTKLGEFHYDLDIPYIDFIKGTEILQENILINSQRRKMSMELMDELFQYFKLMRSFTAKGYLNRMIQEDKKDIKLFFSHSTQEDEMHLPSKIVMQKIEWLSDLLDAIEKNEEFPSFAQSHLFQSWLDEMGFLTVKKRRFFQSMEKRIDINVKNLLYFLKREDYLEILPLYSSLLNIYKLTLITNNALTIDYANKVIDDMKIDELTHLFRKDTFKSIIEKEISFAQREVEYDFCLAYLDIDKFKEINDEYGHFSGDKVLEELGNIIVNSIRNSDMGFRIGGDEFAILLKNAQLEDCATVAQKIYDTFTQTEFAFNDELTFKADLSIGLAQWRRTKDESFDELVKRVDAKLYLAKKGDKVRY